MVKQLYSRAQEGAISNKAALQSENYHVAVVTPQWLKESFDQQRLLGVGEFKPEVEKRKVIVNEDQSQHSSLTQKFKQKSNLFDGSTFAVIENSFDDQEYVDEFKVLINENGGKIVASDQRAKYVVWGDGYEPNIWSMTNDDTQRDNLERDIVHPCWIEECIKHNGLINLAQSLNLVPLPHKSPLISYASLMGSRDKRKFFPTLSEEELSADFGVTFTLLVNPSDKYVFQGLCHRNYIQVKKLQE